MTTTNSPRTVKITDYKDKCMIDWDNGLGLYVIPTLDNTKLYDIVFYIGDTMRDAYRIFQTDGLYVAQDRFFHFLVKLVPFLEVATMKNIILEDNNLKLLTDLVNNNPTWTPVHLIAHLNYPDMLEHNSVSKYLNTPDETTGMSPLQVAVSRQNKECIEVLLEKNCHLNHSDLQGNTVFHYSVESKEIIKILFQDVESQTINCRNKDGYTAIHLACLSGNHESLKELLIAGGEINIPFGQKVTPSIDHLFSTVNCYIEDHPNFLTGRNIQYGGTLLHWADSPKEISELFEHKCDINAIDFEQRTALHIMVQKNKFDCIIALLSRGADPNIQDSNGNTALHLAVQILENIHILHSLIIFGADVNILNNDGESPRHLVVTIDDFKALYCLHAVGAKRCDIGSPNCKDGCSALGIYNGEPPFFVNDYKDLDVLNSMLDVAGMEMVANRHRNGIPMKGRLLSLDGGGIRGLILIQMLLELENVLGKPINHCFDWITGTSTGGILALALASGKTAKECLGLYFQCKERMFPGSRPYPSKPLEDVLEEMLGDDTYLRDITYPKVIIPCCVANRRPIELFLYRNYKSPDDLLKNKDFPKDVLLWHVARATSAAPTYFRPFNNFIDGGLIANNPTLDALTEIHQYNLALKACHREEEQCPVNIVVSLGTGLVPVKDTIQLPEYLPDVLKLLIEAPALLSIIIKQVTETEGRVVERARAWCASLGVPYFRFNPHMSEEVGLNEKCDFKLCRTLWETKAYMHANLQKIKELADLVRDG